MDILTKEDEPLAKDTRQQILDTSQDLFNQQGYTATSMRQIAKACEISVGNLCYHFKRKEELLMAYHNKLYDTMMSHLPPELTELNPWCSYIGAEYAFMYKCATDVSIRKLYLDVINVASLRREYEEKHNELFLKFLPLEQLHIDASEVFLSTVIACSIEFHMMEQYDAREPAIDFDHLFSFVFKFRMELLGINPEMQRDYIEKGFTIGKRIVDEAL
jgi:Transcriptional regulator